MHDPHVDKYTAALSFAERQVQSLVEQSPDYFPIYTVEGRWRHAGELWTDWTGGFLAGMMWQFFKRTDNANWRERAEHYSLLLEHRQHDRNVHDLGFIFLNTYRSWYQHTHDERLHQVLIQAGRTLAMRFKEHGQYLCSFIGPQSLFIDIMMNVPIIIYAANETGDAELMRIAVAHCGTTRDTLVRPDGSTAHEGLFDTATGKILEQSTHQGLRADSNWARGLAWSLYGYSQVYSLTGDPQWLAVAERNADFWLTHLPADHVPYWDFAADLSAPLPWGAQKDSSAAAIAASGLLDLERQTKALDRAVAYRQTALAMLDALVQPQYLASETPSWEGILKHGVYHTKKNLGVDESVMWGEFFLVEALTKVVCPALPKGYNSLMTANSPQPIRLAFLGADEFTAALILAARDDDRFKLVGIADFDESTAIVGHTLAKIESWESLLDDERIDAVVVARGTDEERRIEQLRKLAQVAQPMLVSHPVASSMLVYYELDMIRRETVVPMVPHLPTRRHPAIQALRGFVLNGDTSAIGKVDTSAIGKADTSAIGTVEQVTIERSLPEATRQTVEAQFARDVDVLRAIVGEVTRLGAMAANFPVTSFSDKRAPVAPAGAYAGLSVQVSGPTNVAARWNLSPAATPTTRLVVTGARGRATLELADSGVWTMELSVDGRTDRQTFAAWSAAESSLDALAAAIGEQACEPTWVDASRSVELAETIERSLRKSRTIELHYEEYTEDGTFKGTMASIGCGLLLLTLFVLAAVGVAEQMHIPYVQYWKYLLIALFAVFLVVQLVMLTSPKREGPAPAKLADGDLSDGNSPPAGR